MAKLKKGNKLACVPCGREVVIDACGISRSTIWCCGRPMKPKARKAKKPKRTKRSKKR